jgi:hypothetical protein
MSPGELFVTCAALLRENPEIRAMSSTVLRVPTDFDILDAPVD